MGSMKRAIARTRRRAAGRDLTLTGTGRTQFAAALGQIAAGATPRQAFLSAGFVCKSDEEAEMALTLLQELATPPSPLPNQTPRRGIFASKEGEGGRFSLARMFRMFFSS